MKNSGCINDITVFDFDDEVEVTKTYPRWDELSNPNSEDPSIKYQFLQHASTASINQMKGDHTVGHVHVVAIDDDDDDDDDDEDDEDEDDEDVIISDITPSNLLKIASVKQSEKPDPISEGNFAEHCVNPESSCLDIGINVSRHFRSSGENELISVIVPDSPFSNGSVDARTPDGHDTILENFASTSTSPVKGSSTPRDNQDVDQPVSSLETEEADSIVFHTDYAFYCNRYFPACSVLFTKNCVKVKASSSEDESDRLEWKVDDIVSIESRWSSVDSTTNVKVHFSIKDAERDGIAQDPSVVEVLEFLLCDPRWPWRQELVVSLDTRYKAAWSVGLMGENSHQDASSVDNCESSSYPYIPIFEKPFEVVYPEGDVDAVSISMRDVELLQPETFINDTIIDFYIKYLKNQIPPQKMRIFHFFNSFFFRKLADLNRNQFSALDNKAAFQRVRKWTKKVDIFEKDYIFIPVNYNLHWSLIVICHPGEVAKLNCESNDESLKVPCILHMDSIRGSHMGLKDLIQSYLLEEWKERREETSEDISSNFLNLRFISLELPQQENCSDCGLFLLHYVELFIAEAPANFNPFVINNFQNFLKPDWFIPAEASLKRGHIQRLIYELLESHFLGSAPSFHSQSVQGIGTGLLDMSLCSNRRMRDQSQQCYQGESSEPLRCQNPLIGEEVEVVKHVRCSTSIPEQLRLVDGAFQNDYSSKDCKDGLTRNSDFSDHEESEGNLLSTSNHSCDDSQEMEIIEYDPKKNTRKVVHPIENVDSLTESYDSASSEIMETVYEDSQEMDKMNNQDQEEEEEPLNQNQEDMLQNQSSDQNFTRDENDGIWVVVDSESDEEPALKRICLDDEESETGTSLSDEI